MSKLKKCVLYLAVPIIFLGVSIWFASSYDFVQASFFDKIGINSQISSMLVMLCVLANLPAIFIFGRKAFSLAILYDKGRLTKGSLPYMNAIKKNNNYDTVVESIKNELAKDLYQINENVTLNKTHDVCVASKVNRQSKMVISVTYLFLLQSNEYRLDELNQILLAAFAYIDREMKEHHAMLQPNFVLCLFTDSVNPEVLGKIQDMFDSAGAFLVVYYELSTGHVYFMNGKAKLTGRISKLQALVRQYIVGEADTLK